MNRVVKINDSSLIAEVSYSPPGTAMLVKFKNGQIYLYENVSLMNFSKLICAESVGTHFARNVRDVHKCQKVENVSS